MSERVESLLQRMIAEQKVTNQLLLMLIEALGEDAPGDGDEPSVYMDGSTVAPQRDLGE